MVPAPRMRKTARVELPPLPFDPIAEARAPVGRALGRRAVPAMAAVTSIMRAEQIIIARLNELLGPST